MTTKLTDSKLLIKNTGLNLFGQIFPIIGAFISIPLIYKNLGNEGFGLIAITWMITGYFGLLDLGVGRALTKIISEHLGSGKLDYINSTFLTAIFITSILGIFASTLLLISTNYLPGLFNISQNLEDQFIKSIIILSFSLPIVIISSCLSGVLQAFQRFDLISYIRIPFGFMSFFIPALISIKNQDISVIISAIVFLKYIEFFINLIFCKKILKFTKENFHLNKAIIIQIIKFGGWMSISNIISPLLVYLDRFLITTTISVTAVGLYAAPSEIITRMMIIPGAIVGVIFPAIGHLIYSNKSRVDSLINTGVKFSLIIFLPFSITFIFFSTEILSSWLGTNISEESSLVFKILSVGSVAVCISYFPFALIHSYGRPDITAKIHAVELFIYFIVAYVLIAQFGLIGASVAWVLRAYIDVALLTYCANYISSSKVSYKKISFLTAILFLLLFLSIYFENELILRICIFFIFLNIFVITIYKFFISSSDLNLIKSILQRNLKAQE